jgi:hypothetical protein
LLRLGWPCLIALLFFLCGVSSARAGTVTWTLGANGDWDVAANWSSNPNLPGSADTVQNNTTSTITHDSGNDTINSFLSTGAFILSGGSLTGATSSSTIQVNNTFAMAGGTLSNFILKQGTGGQSITFAAGDNNVLSNVQLFGGLGLSNGGWAYIQNGTTFGAGSTTTLDYGARLYFNNDTTFGANIVLDSSNGSTNQVIANGSSTLTFASTALVQASNTGAGNGVLGGNAIVNNGELSSDAAVLHVGSNTFTNNGTLNAQNGGTIYLDGSKVLLGSGSKMVTNATSNNGAIYLETTLDNTNSTFDPTVNPLTFYNGTLLNGTVKNSEALQFTGGAGNILNGVTLSGGLGLSNGGWAFVVNGTSFGAGSTTTLDYGARLYFDNDTTFGANIVLDSSNGSTNQVIANGSSTLTFASTALVQASNTGAGNGVLGGNAIVNNGELSSDAAVLHVGSNTFTNNGTLNAQNGGTIYLDGGTVYLGSKSKMVTNATSNSGAIYLETTLDNTNSTFDPTVNPLTLYYGTILNGTIIHPASLQFLGGVTNVLNNVALSGGLGLSNGGWAYIQNGTTFGAGSTTTLDYGARLYFNNDTTFGANIVLDSSNGSTNQVIANGSSTLTFASTALVQASNTGAGNGVLGGNAIVNNGELSSDAAVLNVGSNTFTNNGTLNAQNGGTIYLDGSKVLLGSGSKMTTNKTSNSGAIYLEATLDNTNSTFDAINNPLTLYNGTILNGTITHPEALGFVAGTGNVLNGVTLSGGLTLSNGGWAFVVNGTTFGAGSTTTLDNSARLYFASDATFDNATISLGNHGTNFIHIDSTLSLGPNAQVQQTNTGSGGNGDVNGNVLLNSGTISAAGATLVVEPITLLNSGTIEAGASSHLYVQPSNLVNMGTLQATNGGNLAVSSPSFSNAGTILADGSQISVGGGTLTNYGTLIAQNAGAISIGSSFWNNEDTVQADGTNSAVTLGGTFTNDGTLAATNGGQLALTGTLNNVGRILDLTSFNGTFLMQRGYIVSGEVAGSNNLAFGRTSGNGLIGVTLDNGLNLSSGGYARVYAGLTVNGGPVQIDNSGVLAFNDTETFDVATVVFGSANDNHLSIEGTNTLTLGPNATIHGQNGVIGAAEFNGGTSTLVNNGTISADVASGTLTINPNSFTNSGTIQSSNGGTLQVSTSNPTNTGTVKVASGSAIKFSGGYTQSAGKTQADGTLTVPGGLSLQGGTLSGSGTINGNVTNSGGTVTPGDAPGILTLNGNYTQTGSGALDIELGGPTVGTQFDQLDVNGAASLGGTLNISLIGSFQPILGESYDIMDFTSLTGTFAQVNTLNTLGPNLAFDVVYNANDILLTVVDPPGGTVIGSVGRTGSAVPEPGTWALLLAMGLYGSGLFLRARRKARA